MEFTEAESNMNDLVSEYQQYQDASAEEEVRDCKPTLQTVRMIAADSVFTSSVFCVTFGHPCILRQAPLVRMPDHHMAKQQCTLIVFASFAGRVRGRGGAIGTPSTSPCSEEMCL